MPLKFLKFFLLIFFTLTLLNSCKGGDARKNPPDPRERVKKNLEEGKGFRLNSVKLGGASGGNFEFASSNELWKASLDTIDFMPLLSANYSGGIIITDWYSENEKEYIKITIRFLSNEVRSDAVDVKVFYKICEDIIKCKVYQNKDDLEKELKKEILKKAALYKKQTKDKNFKEYVPSDPKN